MKLTTRLRVFIGIIFCITAVIIWAIYNETFPARLPVSQNLNSAPSIVSNQDLAVYQNSYYDLQMKYPKEFTVTLVDGEGYQKEYKSGVDAKSHSSISFKPSSDYLDKICPGAIDEAGQVWINLLQAESNISLDKSKNMSLPELFKQDSNQLSYFGATDNVSYAKKGSLEVLQLKYGENARLQSVVIRTAKHDLLNLSIADNGLCPATYPVFKQIADSIQGI